MTELKTLKDLQKDKGNCDSYELRQEAIKDIKTIKELNHTFQDLLWEKLTGLKIIYPEEEKQAIINYIKWKFNITEEELKEQGKVKVDVM